MIQTLNKRTTSKMKKYRQQARDQVTEIGACDVLLGRGTGPNENRGNKMFRDVLRKYKEAYRIARTKKDKRDIVETAIEEFKASGGRFVQRVVLTTHPSPGKNYYEIVEGPAVSLKARQAFRYLLRGTESDDLKGGPTESTSTPSIVSSPSRQTTAHSQLKELRQPSVVSAHCQDQAHTPASSYERQLKELTLNDSEQLQQLALLAAQAPILSIEQSSPRRMPSWRQQEPFSPAVQTLSDLARTATTDLLLNSLRYPSSLPWTQDGNSQISPRMTFSDLRAMVGQYPIPSSLSPFETRATLLDASWDRLIRLSSGDHMRYHPLSNSHEPGIVEQCAIARAFLEQHHREKRLAELLAPNLKAMASVQESLSHHKDVDKPSWGIAQERQRQANLHRIMSTTLPGDRNIFAEGEHDFATRSGSAS